MATNNFGRFVKNVHGDKMMTKLMPFLAGSSQAVKAGEMLSDVGGYMTPQSADAAMTAELCFAAEEIKAGDPAGYYPVIVPQDGDVFYSELSAGAAAPTPGASVYFDAVSTEKVALTGTNVIGKVLGHNGVPQKQNHADSGAGSVGATIGNATWVEWIVTRAASLMTAFQA